MGSIKDTIDLLIELQGRVQDRKFAAEILKIQSVISSVQSENAELLEKYTQAKKENIDFICKNFELNKKIMELEEPEAFSCGVHRR